MLCEDAGGGYLGRGGPLEGAGGALLVADDAVAAWAPVLRLRHLRLEPVDRALPVGWVQYQVVPHRRAAGARRHQALHCLVCLPTQYPTLYKGVLPETLFSYPATVAILSGPDKVQQTRVGPGPAPRPAHPVYAELKPRVLLRVADTLQRRDVRTLDWGEWESGW